MSSRASVPNSASGGRKSDKRVGTRRRSVTPEQVPVVEREQDAGGPDGKAWTEWSRLPRVILMLTAGMAYGRELALGIGLYARTHGRWRFMSATPGALNLPYTDNFDGDAAIVSLSESFDLDALRKRGIPAVNISGRLIDMPLPSVITDDVAIGRMAADHFLNRGFRHFGYSGVGTYGFAIRRGDAFIAALRGHPSTRSVSRHDVHYSRDWSYETQQQQMTAWVTALPKPVAIFAANDFQANSIADACHRGGIVVPEEVAILGVDNDVTMCEFCDPPLSSIDTNHQHLGHSAAAMLDGLMRGQKPDPRVVLIAPRGVVVRHSTDSLAVGDVEVADAVRFIRDNAHRGIGVEQVLEQVPMNRRMLERRFRRAIGRTPAAEIRRCRIELAKKLLSDTDRSMVEIARTCGFVYPQHLASAFHQFTGMTPTAYRESTGAMRSNRGSDVSHTDAVEAGPPARRSVGTSHT